MFRGSMRSATVPMPDAPTQIDPNVEFMEAAEKRLAVSKDTPVDKPVEKSTTPSESKSEKVASGTAEAKAGDASGADKPAAAPETTQDLSWLPENLRPKATGFESLDPALRDYLQKGHRRRSEHERETAAIKEERERLKAYERSAKLWAKLEESPEVARFVQNVLEGQAKLPAGDTNPASTDDDGIDLTDLLGEPPAKQAATLKQMIRREAESLLKAQERAKAETYQAAASVEDQIGLALKAYAEDNHVDIEAMREAVKSANAWLTKVGGVTVTPQNVVDIVERFIKPTTPVKPSGVENGGLGRVATPSSRGTSAIAPPDVPNHVREGRLPKSNAERTERALHILRDGFGINGTQQDLDRLLGG